MLNELFAIVPDAMITVDPDGRIDRANAQAERLFGYEQGGLLGVSVDELVPEAVRSRHHVHRAHYGSAPRVRPMGGSGQTLIGRRRDGSEIPVEIALSPLSTPGGMRYLASIRDISETQRARQVLVRARYDSLVVRVGRMVMASTDEESAIARLPHELADALDVDAAAVVSAHAPQTRLQFRAGRGLDDALSQALPQALAPGTPLGLAIAAGRSIVIDDFALSQDPRPPQAWLDAGFCSGVIVPLIDREHAPGALLALSRRPHRFDHDAVHCLQSIAHLLSALMQRRRTEEQLAHAQRLEAVGQLTGGIAHDFNNLLTVISGNLQLLEMELADHATAAEFVGEAQRAVQSGAALTAKLLAFARRQRLLPRAIDPGALLQDLGSMLRRTLGDPVKVEIDYSPPVAPIFADASQLESALLNLALNARDAMPRGGLLSITVRQVDVGDEAVELEITPGAYVVFRISDTGHGMAPDVLARAFEPFFTTKEAGKGNGLGLSMVYGFVRQSGGQLRAQSRLGYGTQIDLFLPVARSAFDPQASAEADSAHRGHERVLVVEDEPAVRSVATQFLRKLGYAVLAASDGREALQQLDADPGIALLFSDVALGEGMSGSDLAIAARARRPSLAVLLTSGYEHVADQGAQAPSQRFELLRKPYRLEDLAAALRRQLDPYR
jgi:PAS domain S-box-containing protein